MHLLAFLCLTVCSRCAKLIFVKYDTRKFYSVDIYQFWFHLDNFYGYFV
jgi:hypothetical protein